MKKRIGKDGQTCSLCGECLSGERYAAIPKRATSAARRVCEQCQQEQAFETATQAEYASSEEGTGA